MPLPNDDLQECWAERDQCQAILKIYQGTVRELGHRLGVHTKMNELLDKCKTGENQFGSYWNTRKLMRVLHAYDRVLRKLEQSLEGSLEE